MTTEEEIDLYAGKAVEAFRSLVPSQQDDGVLRAIIRDKMTCVVGNAVAVLEAKLAEMTESRDDALTELSEALARRDS